MLHYNLQAEQLGYELLCLLPGDRREPVGVSSWMKRRCFEVSEKPTAPSALSGTCSRTTFRWEWADKQSLPVDSQLEGSSTLISHLLVKKKKMFSISEVWERKATVGIMCIFCWSGWLSRWPEAEQQRWVQVAKVFFSDAKPWAVQSASVTAKVDVFISEFWSILQICRLNIATAWSFCSYLLKLSACYTRCWPAEGSSALAVSAMLNIVRCELC